MRQLTIRNVSDPLGKRLDELSARYGEVFSQLKRAGTPIPTNDIWIAAVTLECGAHLLSFDEDFSHVAGLSWTRFKR
jgi:tRNA(fMet)-specific endonuclease VapC